MKKKPPAVNLIPEWVMTYGDLMSLLLCFFILLASFSELRDPDQFMQIIDAIQEAIGASGEVGDADVFDSTSPAEIVSELVKKAKKKAGGESPGVQPQSDTVGESPQTSYVHDGNYHTVGTTLVFDGGAVNLVPAMQQVLRDQIAPKIRDQLNVTRIVGHAYGHEDLTLGTYEDVAFKRAQAVREFLVTECGVDARILRIEVAGNVEPSGGDGVNADAAARHRRVQVYTTDRLVEQVTRDPYGSGRGQR